MRAPGGMMNTKRVVVTVVAAVVLAAATARAADKAAQIDALVTQYVELGQFNGAVLVAENGRVLLEKGYGLANMEWGIPNAPDTKFRVGSITKQFTSALVMQLVDEGKLSLDAKLSEVLPGYRKDTGDRVTLRQLLNHTSGIPSYTDSPSFRAEISRDPYAVGDMVTTLCSGDLQFEPGSTFRYNNCGYVLLGAIIEKATGKRYETALQERILDPAGMADTGYDHAATVLPRRAQGYQRTPGGVVNAPYLDMSLPYAAGALYSTVRDLYRWDRALESDKVLSAKAKALMWTPGLGHYGFGWTIATAPIGPGGAERTVISHGGGINGFATNIARIPADGNLVVFLCNTGAARYEAMSAGVWDVLYGRPPAVPKRPVGEVLAAVAMRDGAEAAVARYRQLKATEAEGYDFHERELNNVGYQLLAAGKVDAAVAVFTLNVEMFPTSSNPYDSLGEALAAAGKKNDAIKAYAKSLELDPSNLNAIDQLSKLAKQ